MFLFYKDYDRINVDLSPALADPAACAAIMAMQFLRNYLHKGRNYIMSITVVLQQMIMICILIGIGMILYKK